jgi:hypothetical protein
LFNGQIARLNALQRGDMSAENMINPFASSCFFETYDIPGLFYDTDYSAVPAGIGTDLTDRPFGNITTDFAPADFGFDIPYRISKGHSFFWLGVQYMDGQPFSGLGPHPRQFAKFLYQPV